MRCVTRIGLAALGLALVAPMPARAQAPAPCAECQASPMPKPKPIHICEKCLKAQKANGGFLPPPPVMMMEGAALPPGYTMVGPANGAPMVMGGGGAPGYAVVNGGMPTAEPAPVGVMQTNYSQPGAPTASAPGRASTMPGAPMGVDPSMAMNPRFSNTLASPPARRPRIFGTLFGVPRLAEVREHRIDREKASHASIPYGEYRQPVTELPSSMVYGGR